MGVRYRIDNTYIDENLEDFPVMIYINLSNMLEVEGNYISAPEGSGV
jgi:hypothetical protein